MPNHTLAARTLTDEQVSELIALLWNAFYADLKPEEAELQRALLEPDRTHAVFDGATMIGGGSILTRSMTLPGAGPVPIAAVTAVGVAPDQRRRGALTTLMRAQLHGLHEAGGEPVAALWASEGGIYGRFGYGLASRGAILHVLRGAQLRKDVDPGTERVTMLDAETAGATMRKLHAEYASTRIGGLSRTEPAWNWLHADPEHWRNGASALRYAAVSGGYVRFRVKENWDTRHKPEHEVWVRELVSLTPQAHAALWQFLANLDLAGTIQYHNAALDDPLPLMFDNPRMATMEVFDGLYVRLVDVDRALQARRYSAPLDVVLDVTDEFCPWNAGRWQVSVDGGGTAQVRRAGGRVEADLACSTSALGSAYLGGIKLGTLAAAGRVRELRPGALRAADAAFAGDHAPHCLENF